MNAINIVNLNVVWGVTTANVWPKFASGRINFTGLPINYVYSFIRDGVMHGLSYSAAIDTAFVGLAGTPLNHPIHVAAVKNPALLGASGFTLSDTSDIIFQTMVHSRDTADVTPNYNSGSLQACKGNCGCIWFTKPSKVVFKQNDTVAVGWANDVAQNPTLIDQWQMRANITFYLEYNN